MYRHSGLTQRRGSVLPFLALTLIAMLTMVAMAIDIGVLAVARTHAQNAVDAAAMAAVRELNGVATNNNFDAVLPAAQRVATGNSILDRPVSSSAVTTEVGYYAYNTTLKRFEANLTGTKPANEAWSAVRVSLNVSQPTLFAKIMRLSSMPVSTSATAVHRPRDVGLILDFSGSMRFNSLIGYPYTGTVTGSLNPDPDIPRFGHWSSIQSVMRRTTSYVDSSGQVFAPCNMTVETDNGPAIVYDFLTKNASGSLVSAFAGSSGTYDPNVWAVPAPADWDLQANTTSTYWNSSGTGKGGDLWPRKSNVATNAYAATVQEFLLGTNNSSTYSSLTHNKITTNRPGGGTAPFDPANHNAPTVNEGYGPTFKGYSMGPGWYGKTFYVWPPDPRWHPSNTTLQLDWRKRFFFNEGTTTPLGGSSTTSTADNRADNSLLWDTSGNWREANSTSATTYSVNYNAIVAWLKSGPKVLPDNLRAGRVLYYNSIPDTIPTSGGTEDQRFWRAYINYVIGAGTTTTQQQSLYGRHSSGWGTVKITAKASLNATQATRPYMHYNDNPIRPRLHFWFGPLTMLDFLSQYDKNFLPGTCHESQSWQLKAAVQSAISDVQKNHPNDWVTMIYFSNLSNFNTARVSLGRDYTRLKNALFYPYSLLDSLGDPAAEIRPYNNVDTLTWATAGNVPSATGGTAPEMAFKVAYNEFSCRTGYNGRRGASKMLIFETDGVPNHTAAGTFTNGGAYNSMYSVTGSTTSYSNNDSTVVNNALAVVDAICNLDTNSSVPGYSSARNKARVHAIGFGDLFDTPSTSKDQALDFLLQVQKRGNTSAATATSIESYKIVVGDYNTRIENLRTALERIFQSGVQVTLIR
ncbi:MAG: pilus assembly protein TadG-related protein [Gemmataceae bacterium]